MSPSARILAVGMVVAAATLAAWMVVSGGDGSASISFANLRVVDTTPAAGRGADASPPLGALRPRPPSPAPLDTTGEVRIDDSVFTYAVPEEGLTIQDLVSDMATLTGVRFEMSEYASFDSRRIKLFEPVTIPRTGIRDFFEMVLAVHLYAVSDVDGQLLVEGMGSTGMQGVRARHPFLHPDALKDHATDTSTVVSTAIPIAPLTPWEAHDVLLAVPRNANREGYCIGDSQKWVLGYWYPASAVAIRKVIDEARGRKARGEAILPASIAPPPDVGKDEPPTSGSQDSSGALEPR